MELFFFLLLSLMAGGAYFHSRDTPNVWANAVLFLTVIVLSIGLYTSGLTIPNTGATYTSSTITFTGTDYTMANSPIIFGLTWILLAIGIIGLGTTVGVMTESRVDRDGRIH